MTTSSSINVKARRACRFVDFAFTGMFDCFPSVSEADGFVERAGGRDGYRRPSWARMARVSASSRSATAP
jgi:hypothetical protein